MRPTHLGLALLLLVASLAVAEAATSPDSSPSPYQLVTLTRQWDGDPHARPRAVVELVAPDGRTLWQVPDVVGSHRSADGRTLALVTARYELLVARLPEPPRLAGGSVFTAACSPDGRLVAVHQVGDSGDGLMRLSEGLGIALLDVDSMAWRVVLHGSDLYAPSFASEDRLFFGSGGPEQLASLWLLDLASGRVVRLTNRDAGEPLQLFPSEHPVLKGGSVHYVADDGTHVASVPAADTWEAAPRFDPPPPAVRAPDGGATAAPIRLRRPTTTSCTYGGSYIYQYFDLDRRLGYRADWNCRLGTYDGHRGTDFCQRCGTPVAAPAAGWVVYWYDGCPNYGNTGNGCGYGWGNHVALMHADETVSLEAHGKAGTVQRQGNATCGATIMLSCSSGNSNVDHIHHENWRNLNGRTNPAFAFDPYQGPCDAWEAPKWTSQGTYGGQPGTACP